MNQQGQQVKLKACCLIYAKWCQAWCKMEEPDSEKP